jgi:hypothetical protein
MLDTQDLQAAGVRLLLSTKETRRALADIGETMLWDLVKRGLLRPSYMGRKAVFPAAEVRNLARRIEAGELAPARGGFKNHEAAIANSIATRRRKRGTAMTSAPAAPSK